MNAALRFVCLFVAGLGAATPASAAIRPSFSVQACAGATDIVVARALPGGYFVVIETWKGDLGPGYALTIPELAPFQARAALDIHEWIAANRESVSATRVILFLKKEPARTTAKDDPPVALTRWTFKPAHSYGGWKVSFAWIHANKAYAHVQVMNPGPSVLVPLDLTEQQLAARVAEIVKRGKVKD